MLIRTLDELAALCKHVPVNTPIKICGDTFNIFSCEARWKQGMLILTPMPPELTTEQKENVV